MSPKKWSEADLNREKELVDAALDWLHLNVLKLIATRVVPLVVGSGAVVAVLAWLQDTIGLNLDPAVVTAVAVSIMGAVIAAVFAYVKNHGGAAQLGGILLELAKLRELGAEPPVTVTGTKGGAEFGEPTVPPGVEHQGHRIA